MNLKEQKKKHRFWMNLAFGYIVALFTSVVVLFFNLGSIYISVSCFTICFITVIGAKICFARADKYEVSQELVITEDEPTTEELMANNVTESVNLDANKEDETDDCPLVADVVFTEEMSDCETLETNDMETNENISEIEGVSVEETTVELTESTIEQTDEIIESDEGTTEIEKTTLKSDNELDAFEQEILDQITGILNQHHRDTSSLSTKKVGNYFDVQANATIARFKLKGRKQYLLSHLEESVLKEKGLTVEAPSKNEKFNSRIILTSSDVLQTLSDYIVENFDKAC
ncbi:MAG TPA: hypothetical protein DCY20_10110 [Firmicutes bacterium]|nr:hypothetical protein [Bacillota bacterium]